MNTTIVPVTWPLDTTDQPDLVMTFVHDFAGPAELLSYITHWVVIQPSLAGLRQFTLADLARYIQGHTLTGKPEKIIAWSVYRTGLQVMDGSRDLLEQE